MQNDTQDVYFKIMAEQSTDILCRMTLNMRCVYCSPASLPVLGWTSDEMLVHFPTDLIHPEDLGLAQAAHRRYVAGKCVENGPATMRVRKEDGSYAWLEVNSSLMRNERTGAPWQMLLNMRDIGKRIQLEQHLETLALTDPLTTLGNRRAFDLALDHEWRRARRGREEVSLLLLDIDHFKGINDLYGHVVGDDCLCAIASAIASAGRRPGDMAARYGGEEFALILPATGEEGALAIAETVRLAIKELRFPHDRNAEHGSVVTVSIGSATAVLGPRGAVTPLSLLRAADTALYKAKQEGRNRVEAALLMAKAG